MATKSLWYFLISFAILTVEPAIGGNEFINCLSMISCSVKALLGINTPRLEKSEAPWIVSLGLLGEKDDYNDKCSGVAVALDMDQIPTTIIDKQQHLPWTDIILTSISCLELLGDRISVDGVAVTVDGPIAIHKFKVFQKSSDSSSVSSLKHDIAIVKLVSEEAKKKKLQGIPIGTIPEAANAVPNGKTSWIGILGNRKQNGKERKYMADPIDAENGKCSMSLSGKFDQWPEQNRFCGTISTMTHPTPGSAYYVTENGESSLFGVCSNVKLVDGAVYALVPSYHPWIVSEVKKFRQGNEKYF